MPPSIKSLLQTPSKKPKMKSWKDTLLPPSATVREAIETVDQAMQIAAVVEDNYKLVGIVTDKDIRQAILRKIRLDDPVTTIMNANPTVGKETDSKEHIIRLFQATNFRSIPIVNESSCLVDIEFLSDVHAPRRPNPVVLMAGGLGSRLHPLTVDCPKPLLKVGDKPLLETILENFIEYGFHKFYISVNYKAEMIENYFGDGSKWEVEIQYLRENKKTGTAGALSLLPTPPQHPIFVMNGDLLTKVNFENLLDFHKQHKAEATMCVREYDLQIPYGVTHIKNHWVVGLEEKPIQAFFVNAGIYVLSPDMLRYIPEDTFFNMTELFDKLIVAQHAVAAFPIREYWLDIGQKEDFERANGEFSHIFSTP